MWTSASYPSRGSATDVQDSFNQDFSRGCVHASSSPSLMPNVVYCTNGSVIHQHMEENKIIWRLCSTLNHSEWNTWIYNPKFSKHRPKASIFTVLTSFLSLWTSWTLAAVCTEAYTTAASSHKISRWEQEFTSYITGKIRFCLRR